MSLFIEEIPLSPQPSCNGPPISHASGGAYTGSSRTPDSDLCLSWVLHRASMPCAHSHCHRRVRLRSVRIVHKLGAVSASVTSCSASTIMCTLSVSNAGTANAQIAVDSCTVDLGGAPFTGVNVLTVFSAGTTATPFQCDVSAYTGTAPSVGAQAVGGLSLSNSATVAWTGTWVAQGQSSKNGWQNVRRTA